MTEPTIDDGSRHASAAVPARAARHVPLSRLGRALSRTMRRVGYAWYYLFISRLPHSRFSRLSNQIRVWYLCRILKIMQPGGERTYVEHHVFIGGPGRVKFGKSCQINENTFIQEADIGSYVMIAPNVAIISSMHNHARLDIPMIFQGTATDRKVVIEDDVWLGRNVVVMPGVNIGRGSIVAAGAVVTGDVPEYTVVGGVPARVIRDRRPGGHAVVVDRSDSLGEEGRARRRGWGDVRHDR